MLPCVHRKDQIDERPSERGRVAAPIFACGSPHNAIGACAPKPFKRSLVHDVRICSLCVLRQEAEGGPYEPVAVRTPTPEPPPEPCAYKGETIRTEECRKCGNRQVQIAVFLCELQNIEASAERWTAAQFRNQVCRTCPHHQP